MISRQEFNICRLCLREPCGSFLLIDEPVKKMLDVLFVKLNFNGTDNPPMCGDCALIVKGLVSFKSVYLKSEKLITLFCINKNIANVDIKDLYSHNSKIIDDYTEICRFCMNKSKGSSFISLDGLLKQNTFSYILKMYMCELDMEIVKNPLTCLDCRDNMERYRKFLQNCCETEEKINAYQENNRVNGQKIMLDNVSINKGVMDTCTCGTKDSGHCLSYHAMLKEVALATEDIKMETVQSEVNHPEFKIETEELIIKDEVALNENFSEKEIIGEKSKSQLFECDSCDFKTKHKRSLNGHTLTQHTKEHMHQCDTCQYKTKTKSNFTRHMLIHKDYSEVQLHQCVSCDFETKCKGTLKKHMLVHKDSSEVQMYHCNDCKFQTKYRQNLKSHQSKHKDPSEVQIYQCCNCEFKTKYRTSIKNHLLSHKERSEPLLLAVILNDDPKIRQNISGSDSL